MSHSSKKEGQTYVDLSRSDMQGGFFIRLMISATFSAYALKF
jgi:hypothetical protein